MPGDSSDFTGFFTNLQNPGLIFSHPDIISPNPEKEIIQGNLLGSVITSTITGRC